MSNQPTTPPDESALPTSLSALAVDPATLPDSPGTLVARRTSSPIESYPAPISADVPGSAPFILNKIGEPIPTPRQKFQLAVADLFGPGTFTAIVVDSGFREAVNANSANGPGARGLGRRIGYSYSQAAIGEFIGAFAIASLVHENPYYHRLPNAKFSRRFWHAVVRTAVAEHDDGSRMPNYEILLTYPVCELIAGQYVPGSSGTPESIARRAALDYATDPFGNLANEFLPDIASHVHLHVTFFQGMVDNLASGPPVTSSPGIGCTP